MNRHEKAVEGAIKADFVKDAIEARNEMFKEYDRMVLKKLDRITRLGRAKAFDAGFAACLNLWMSLAFPEPEAPEAEAPVQENANV